MADADENIAIGVDGFLQTWLDQLSQKLREQLKTLRRLAPYLGPNAKQIQANCSGPNRARATVISCPGPQTVCGTD